jgi:AcrR family transcriptional regulator
MASEEFQAGREQPGAVLSEIDAKLAARHNRRMRGKPDDGAASWAHIPEGPEIIGETTPLPQRSARSDGTRERLLDVAEMLFARSGYTGVSVRDVTDLAQTRLAHVTYIFGSKQNLYLEVLRRRAGPLAEDRERALAALLADPPTGDLEWLRGYVAAYVEPAVARLRSGEAGWKSYLRLIANVAYSRLWPNSLIGPYNETAYRYLEALQDRFPVASPILAQHLFLMMVASSMYTLARTGRVETFAQPAFSSDDLDTLGPLTRQFIVDGFAGALIS